ncbi:MAG: MBL fold metallo-hydrolase, partial [Pseudomonadota bacterium]
MPPDLTDATATANAAAGSALPLRNPQDDEDAAQGRIAQFPPGGVRAPDGRVIWDMAQYDFLDAPCPASVHPALWRHAQLNAHHGLFEITPGIWQARGCDYANLTIIDGASGWILVDPLMTAETSAAVLAMVNERLGARPVSAVLVTHCHADHFAGLAGVVREGDGVPIIVPEGFLRHAASEAIFAGTAMARRAIYQFGLGLAPGPMGTVDGGIGKAPAKGTRTFVRPTEEITATGEERVIDGVRFRFQIASGTEAPAEFTFLLPDHRVLCMAEICTRTLHNLVPPRGAQVRDPLLWARVIDEAIGLFAAEADILINSHNWPVTGQDALTEYLYEQRDIYKYLHDQTLRLANLGHTPDEITGLIEEPDWLSQRLHARGFYGSLKFNARAIYQRYFGFYDGN